MHAKRIIPCLDVNNGRVVKGTSFVNLRDAGDPVEAAIAYDKQGADELVLLDITASHEGRGTMLHIVQEVAKTYFYSVYRRRRSAYRRGYQCITACRCG